MMLRSHFNVKLIKSIQSRLISPQRRVIRLARTRAGTITSISSSSSSSSIPIKPKPTKPKSTIPNTHNGQQILNKPLTDSQLQSQNKQRVSVNRDILLLEQLNIARPGTPTDIRYKRQIQAMSQTYSEEEKIQELFLFLAQEALLELEQYPNPDEVEDDNMQMAEAVNVDLESQMEWQLKKQLTSQWNVTTTRYKRWEILLTVLEKLHQKSNGAYLVPVESLVALYDASKYILEDGEAAETAAASEIQAKVRYLCGDLVYSLGKFEFDLVNESLYVEALMKLGLNARAREILIKRNTKLINADGKGLRWWRELIVVNQIDMKELVGAEQTVSEINEVFQTEYLDSRIYAAFIRSYLEGDNFERVVYWVNNLNTSVEKNKGWFGGEIEEPGLESDEETVLAYLNRQDPVTKQDYLSIMETLLSANNIRYHSVISKMIDFYLTQERQQQPETNIQEHMEELIDLLLKFRFEYRTKIKPILESVPSRHQLEETLIPLFEQLRELNPTETSHADLLDEYFASLSKTSGGFEKIIKEMRDIMKYVMDDENTPKLSSKNFYALISALIKARKYDQAYEILSQLEQTKNELEHTGDELMECSSLLIPPVTTNHYVPFLRHYGRTSQMDKFQEILTRFEANMGVHNPVILTQIINSLSKNKQYDQLLRYVNLIALKDIHLQDQAYQGKPLNQLYSSIWTTLASYLKSSSSSSSSSSGPLPDLRYLFLKTTQQSQIIPSRDDYDHVITAFISIKDYYAVVCVLEYMGSKHKVIPSQKTLKAVESAMLRLKIHTLDRRSSDYQAKLDELRREKAKLNTLDPFAVKPSQPSSSSKSDEDFFEPELTLTLTEAQQKLYKMPIKRLYETLSGTVGFDEVYLGQSWREFGLDGDVLKGLLKK